MAAAACWRCFSASSYILPRNNEYTSTPTCYFVHFLGTSSGVPTATRNVTSQCIRFPSDRLWLLDCGNLRFIHHGLTFEKIDKIFITHLHGDHCYGIFGLLMMLAMKGGKRQSDVDGGKVPFEVVGPKGIRAMIEGVFAHSQSFLNFPIVYTELDEGQPHDLGVKDDGWHVWAYPLTHRVPCFGYVFKEPAEKGTFDAPTATSMGAKGPQIGQLAKGGSVTLADGRVISHADCLRPGKEGRCLVLLGDTHNSDSIDEAAKGCDLLVHEATFDATMEERARDTGHSTTYEQPWNEEKVPSIEELLEETRAQCPDIAAAENVFAAHDYWWIDLPKKT
ncbi:ribonuclease z, putative [Acanthamoeba castellanii str. Neff]|uniref:Ribonuclease z, putative n=1 Tax=Acanthamoeba castellanii (strain ATCC 30010 / Neff) TaxID=1257118 RepID=L8HFU9_ACACF|nr:ribonuclease z, putative [Acanthamoeba castellanii str. Neff]ELR23326.1 ribonuclease z, putative [Acanthamoeba castellanii str. Neff]